MFELVYVSLSAHIQLGLIVQSCIMIVFLIQTLFSCIVKPGLSQTLNGRTRLPHE